MRTNGHRLIIDAKAVYDSTESFFEQTGPREAFKSDLFRELMLWIATLTSFRDGARLLNRMRRAKDGIIETTLRNCVEREGAKIIQCMEGLAAGAAEKEGLCVDARATVTWERTGEAVAKGDIPTSPAHVDEQAVHAAAARLGLDAGSYDPADYELCSVNISSDEVGVRRQTDCRPRTGEPQLKRVQNSVVHVEVANEADDPGMASSSSYILTSPSVAGAFKVLFGFLCANGLLEKTLVFFVDGAKNLNGAIGALYGFLDMKVILDWYHLRKKMEETLSTVCNNTRYRNGMLQKTMPLLWRGDIDGAVAALLSMDMGMVKDKGRLDYLVGYLGRVRANVPNYMLRDALGLRNSSNRGEKANDLVVAERQKHNGMSWSDAGSTALAAVSAVQQNDELDNWVSHGTLSLQLVERTTPKREKRDRRRTETSYSNSRGKVVDVAA